jgi:thymidylate synthase
MKQYVELVRKIKEKGSIKGDRTGTGTKSIFGHQVRFIMSDGFPLLTLKKTHFKSIVHELLWFIKGDTNIKYLNANGVKIWNEWADDEGELGPIYGSQWVNWLGYREGVQAGHMDGFGNFSFQPKGINQLVDAIYQLKNNPDSRRIMVNAWNVSEIPKMKLPPCHYGFQFYTRDLSTDERNEWFDKNWGYGGESGGKNNWKDFELDQQNVPKRTISLMWNQRSVDTFLGLPFNIASYALLLHMVAKCVNMVPDELVGNLGDTHLYLNHSEQVDELLKRWDGAGGKSPKLPSIKLNEKSKDLFSFKYEDIVLEGYEPLPSIKAPIAV